MAVNDEFLPTRKAFSAEKSKNTFESQTSDGCFEDIGNKTFKTCSSASFLSARERRHAQKISDSSLQEEFTSRYIKVHYKENLKLFLKSSQILEKLSKVISKSEHSLENASANHKLKLKHIVVYHDKLKKLLVERSSMILIEECDIAMKRTAKLIESFKQLYMNEKLKMTTLPIQAFNRFISSSDIQVSTLELLINKLKIICDMHLSLNSNHQNMINLFHISTNIELHKTILKVNDLLKIGKTDVFYWSHKCIKLFLQKLCLADPNSISPDFLQSILKAIYVYNSLIKDNKEEKFISLRTCYIFYDFKLHHEYVISFDLLLQILSFFEAKVAAERIVNFLTCNCKKLRQADFKRKSLIDRETPKGDTSDYCSVTENDGEQIIHKTFATTSSNFVNILLALMQRNQSLILKYMYAVTNLESILFFRNRNFDNKTPTLSARQMWDLPQLYNTDESYLHLEEDYWANFWNNTKKFILKLLFDVPHHQYGDFSAGTVILWPDSFLQILSESLKSSIDNKELSLEGRHIMKQIYDYLFIHQIKLAWDKEYSSLLPATQSHLCHPVPTFQNQINTHPGNSLNKCLDTLLAICSDDVQDMEFTVYLSVFFHLQATLDTYVLWVNVKTRALIASQNLPTYLLISSSDCNNAVQQLEVRAAPLISELESSTLLRRVYPSQITLFKIILRQIDILCGHVSEANIIIYEFCFISVKQTLDFLLKSSSVCTNCLNATINNSTFDTVIDILSPMSEVLNHLLNLYPIILSITTAVCQAFLYVLNNIKSFMNAKKIHILSIEHLKFVQWLNNLNLLQTELEKLKHSQYLTKLTQILKFIEDFLNRPKGCWKRRNQIAPHSQIEVIPMENILSEEEKTYWQEVCSKSISLSCL